MMTQRGFATWAWLGLALAGVTGALAEEPAQEPPKTLKNSIGLELVLIPAGEFDIGTPDSATYNPWPQEKPQHRVKITKAFYLGKFEVTQQEYEKVMGKNPSYFSKTGKFKDHVKDLDTSQFPVEEVSWDDAQAFCAKLSNLEEEKKAGRVYRLPTSAEWEYANRAGTTTLFYFGDTVSFKDANFGGGTLGAGEGQGVGPKGAAMIGMFGREDGSKPPPGRTTKVGSYPPNPWGLYDIHGNVLEWCQDYMSVDYYKLKVTEDPQGPTQGSKIGDASPLREHVVRGGSWRIRSNYNRSACRFGPGQIGGPGQVGFRVVCVAAAATP